ncbi:hypothetical protein PIB30_075523 [Stylosanthes scabra]|uniref:Uncharacterized protein n=1 Tax=Stylosanthes scabra TaxID=79078 RepID=A0ABU6ZPB0_9FABA|nr:hypothetical protein [Stylosanthes scabra]
MGYGVLDFNPVVLEAHIVYDNLFEVGKKETKFDSWFGEWGGGPSVENVADSDKSCPYPPGFGPCMDHAHVHRELGRAQHFPQIAAGIPAFVSVPELPPPSDDESLAALDSEKGYATSVGDEELSDETLYKINVDAFRGVLGEEVVVGVGETEVTSVVRRDKTKTATVPVCGLIDSGAGVEAVVVEVADQQYGQWDNLSDDLREEDDSFEIAGARELWIKGVYHSLVVMKMRLLTD